MSDIGHPSGARRDEAFATSRPTRLPRLGKGSKPTRRLSAVFVATHLPTGAAEGNDVALGLHAALAAGGFAILTPKIADGEVDAPKIDSRGSGTMKRRQS